MQSMPQNSLLVPVILLSSVLSANLQAGQLDSLPLSPPLSDYLHLDIRILVGRSAASRVNNRAWSELFRKAGHRVTIATNDGSKQAGIRARQENRQSVVDVIGLVDRRGVLRLGRHEFRLGNAKPLKLFLDDIAKNGPDGPIRLRPTWGLSVGQFKEVLKLLSAPVKNDVSLSSPLETIQTLQLPSEFRVTWSRDSQKIARSRKTHVDSIDLQHVSMGTGLAVALAQFSLGFRVMERADNQYWLEIDLGDESSNLWPVGWKNKEPLTAVIPKLYEPVPVDLLDAEVIDVIDAVAERIEVSCFCSHGRLAETGVKIDHLTYSAAFGRRSPFRLLRSIGGQHRFGIDTRTDEAGRLFLWCTTVADQRAWKKRFAHVIPGKSEQ